jgi:hypothetical protein
MAAELGWDAARVDAEVDGFLDEAEAEGIVAHSSSAA